MYLRKSVTLAALLLLTVVTIPIPAHAGPGAVPDAPLYPNGRPTYYANSPAGLTPIMDPTTGVTTATNSGTALRKFVDSLAGMGLPGCTPGPGVNPCNENNLGNYIPIATADTATFPGSDYYVIGFADYRQKMHSDLLAPTDAFGTGAKLRGYYEIIGGVAQPSHYLGPVILATKNKPVRVLFKNLVTSGAAGLFIPVDTTVMGAGKGPDGVNTYSQNRATVHLHGGHTPWISDGTPHQWVAPAGEATTFGKGLSFQNVPDMVGAGKPIPTPTSTDGLGTYFWTNEQSGRFMFYHDHAHGITRLNVYAGAAAGYLIVDPQESVMMAAGTLPDICDPAVNGGLCAYKYGIPLVIQDKSFVPANVGGTAGASGQDTKWNIASWGGEGNLWFPHVYEPNQDLAEPTGLNPAGRWDYGPYVWPPSPVTNPVLPTVSLTPEAFMDTPIVNGTAYPYLPVERKAYRFRILSAGNDRSFNLQLYYAPGAGATATATLGTGAAAGTVASIAVSTPGSGYTIAPRVFLSGGGGTGATATAVLGTGAAAGTIASITVNTPGTGYTTAPTVAIAGTEVSMVDAVPRPACNSTAVPAVVTNCVCSAGVGNSPAGCFPATYPIDGRDGGVPDPAFAGPQMIQIGNESGFLPAPVVLPNHPITFDAVGNVANKTLLLMPAERADVVVDFTNAPAGSTVILYNDAPAALPGGDPRYDYYTGNPDQTASGGAPSTLAGFGPNMRTVMQFRVTNGANTAPTVTAANLGSPTLGTGLFAAAPGAGALATAYAASQPAHIVPAGQYAKLTDTALSLGGVPVPFKGKSINEGFDPIYGRINAMLGTEAPDGLTPPTPLDYASQPTEILHNDQVQLWKITHNGVDSHPIHFHLEDLQVVNRIGWDGSIRPPDPSEAGWKETIRMNPLEDIIVAMRPTEPVLPFALPNSIRPLDPTFAVNTMVLMNDPATGGMQVPVLNVLTNFGHEYVWHCHILGHEEFDLMRPVVLDPTPTNILWKNSTTGWTSVWYMDGTTVASSAFFTQISDPNWQLVGSGDFNSDGQPDLVWKNTSTGWSAVWYMNGTTTTGSAFFTQVPDTNWEIVGVGDFNGDGKPDLLWRNKVNGQNAVWYMNGTTMIGSAFLDQIADTNWKIAGVGDFNNDGKSDILWTNTLNGQVAIWYMNGAVTTGSAWPPTQTDLTWQLVGVGDFNNDVYPDLLWRNSVSGANMVWFMNGATQIGTGTLPAITDLNWKIAGTN